MLSKVRGFLSSLKKDRQGRERSSEAFLAQADLSEKLLWTLGLAKKLGLRVYIRIDVGNQSHAISVQGKDDPTIGYLYDLADESWKSSLVDAKEAKLAEQAKAEVADAIKRRAGKGLQTGFK
jgi:hypothetical protein